jgi:hypothetical protein
VSGGRRSRASAPLPLSSSSGLRSAQMSRLELLANTWNAVGSFTGAACDANQLAFARPNDSYDGSAKTCSIRVTNF